jgi:hypothetical protein
MMAHVCLELVAATQARREVVRTVSYPLPAELHGHVLTVANDSDISTNQNALRIAVIVRALRT